MGIPTLYLATGHTAFYERYGWRYYCPVQCDGDDHLSRMYIHETTERTEKYAMKWETERLLITEFTPDMAHDVHLNSLDEDTRRFVPDEVFETEEDAKETVDFLISCYGGEEGPFVYPVLSRDGANLGYVQLAPIDEGWEIGYHIAKRYTGKGYASEAVSAFLPRIMEQVGAARVYGICIAENAASRRVMEKCGFGLVFEGPGQYQETEQLICQYVFPK